MIHDSAHAHARRIQASAQKNIQTINNQTHHSKGADAFCVLRRACARGHDSHYYNKNSKLSELEDSDKVYNPAANYRAMETLI